MVSITSACKLEYTCKADKNIKGTHHQLVYPCPNRQGTCGYSALAGERKDHVMSRNHDTWQLRA